MENNFTIKTYMAIMAERDAAIRERNMALDERRRAFAERDMAMLQRDAAVAERNSAVEDRDKALAALEFRESSMNENNIPPSAPGDGTKHLYLHLQQQQMQSIHHFAETASNPREIPTSDPFQRENIACEAAAKPRKVKQTRETKGTSTKKNSKYTRKGKVGAEGFSQVTVAIRNGWENMDGMDGNSEDLDGQFAEYKDNLGLSQVNFDESTMPVPVCTCTGVPQPCYKWGNGGWQSACCTTTMSMYPLPQMSNKRHSRVGGRKMSGGAFNKLLNRLVAEGYDLYNSPLDLKDHWAKHGTNRYSTLK